MKNKYSKFTKKWLSRGNKFKEIGIVRVKSLLIQSSGFLKYISFLAVMGLALMFVLSSFWFDINIKNYFVSLSFIFLIWEVKGWLDEWIVIINRSKE